MPQAVTRQNNQRIPVARTEGRFDLPVSAGVGLRHPHIQDFLDHPEDISKHAGWVEVHSENFLGAGGPRNAALAEIASHFPLSCHGVGLSMGSADGLDQDHLSALADLYERMQPVSISEHVAWSVDGGTYLNDLLPLPYTPEALSVIVDNIDHAQQVFGRQILMENPSSYVTFRASSMPEWDFMSELARRTGCGLLLDVNNIHVSAHNHEFDAEAYLDAVPLDHVKEIHIAGHMMRDFGDQTLLIDDHGSAVSEPVWNLYISALRRMGPVPTLVEWDNNIPALDVLLDEADKAMRLLAEAGEAYDVAQSSA